MVESAFEFGRHLGMAFQLLDDVLDFVGQESKLGKPAGGSDLQLGLATGPVLFAAQQVIFAYKSLIFYNHKEKLLISFYHLHLESPCSIVPKFIRSVVFLVP